MVEAGRSLRTCAAWVRRALVPAGLVSLSIGDPPAWAAGSEPPSLHAARQQGKGGTGIASAQDPSALFHNPAGLRGVGGVELLASGGLAFPDLRVAPRGTNGAKSSSAVVPFGMLAVAWRAHDWLSLGASWQPIAGGRPEFEYELPSEVRMVQKLDLAVIEFSPGASLNVPAGRWLPGELSFGVGYRLTSYALEQSASPAGGESLLRLDVGQWHARGFRAGIQYSPVPAVGLGLVYRSRLRLRAVQDAGLIGGQPVRDLVVRTVLPAKLGAGLRLGNESVSGAFDWEYSFGSQNRSFEIDALAGGQPLALLTPQQWTNTATLRLGVEFGLGPLHEWRLRLGYIRDGAMTSQRFPSLFSSPPTETHSLTFGVGYGGPRWSLNAAVTDRFGSVQIPVEAVAPDTECASCGGPGFFGQHVATVLFDASLRFEP